MSDTTTMTETRMPVCSTCGSRHVLRDAWARWSEEARDWALGTVFDKAYCETCDHETRLEMVTGEEAETLRCRYLNDQLRRGQGGPHDRIVVTQGVAAISDAFPGLACAAVAAYATFTEDNDPYGEHDFGAIEINGERLFFKIDYYNLALDGHSPDKGDLAVTARVLTIILAQEY